MKFSVLQFPGSNCDQDCVHAIRNVLGHPAGLLWHKECDLGDTDAVVIPGGFSYGDYLRTGAIARFSPIMTAVQQFADAGGLVLGICNGFQILCEAGLLPGALVKNRSLHFRCEWVYLKTLTSRVPFTQGLSPERILRIPIAHGDGCFFIDGPGLEQLKRNDQLLWQYVDAEGEATEDANPNGSLENVAGICNRQGNVAGLMPHPERACESLLGGTDGELIFKSLIDAYEKRATLTMAK